MKLDRAHKKHLSIAVIISIVVLALLMRQFTGVIASAAITAYIFIPIYNRFFKRFKKPGIAAAITVIVSILVFVIPIIVVSIISFYEIRSIIVHLDQFLDSGRLAFKDTSVTETINSYLGRITEGSISLDSGQIQNYIVVGIKGFGQLILNATASTVSSLPRMITNFILYIYVYSALLMYNKQLISQLKKLNPLGDEVSDLYLQKAGAMTSGMIKGQLLIALAQGVAGAFFLKIVGINYFAFFSLLLTILSIVPLGGGIISIPIGVILLFTGNVWGGLIVLLSHFFIITNIDNVLKPMIVPKAVRLNSALLILSVFAGISVFGFIGIVLGPVIMILCMATIEVYTATEPKYVDTTKQETARVK